MSEPIPPIMPDSDATIMIPRPGGKRAPGAPAVQPAYTPPREPLDDGPTEVRPVGVNPLVAAANPLLSLVPQIRATLSHPDPNGLRDYLLRAIAEFEQTARELGIAPETILVARYALCTVLDETVASTPWGGTSQWAQASLLVTLHRETWGGEKFFQLLNKMAEDPVRNLQLLELMYACLALGFEGRYRIIENGKAQLEQLRGKVYQIIRQQRGDPERDLSVHWRGVARKPKSLVRQIPPWVVGSVTAFVLLAIYLSLLISLNQQSDTVFSALAAVKAESQVQRAAAPLSKPRLPYYLADEINQGLLEVKEDAQTSRIVINSDQLFEAGSADVNPTVVPLIMRITNALNRVPGLVVVTGHTDDRPIRSIRFPSNYHLSVERANSVLRLIANGIDDNQRLRAEGMADSQPVAPNDTPANRARNRRVEILLRVAS